MERLTRKSLEYKDTWIADGSLSNIEGVVKGNAIDRLAELEDVLEKYGIENAEELDRLINQLELSQKEIQQLNQQLHDLPKKIVGDIADELGDCGKAYLECEPYIRICIVKGVLQAILKKYGDKNESNND